VRFNQRKNANEIKAFANSSHPSFGPEKKTDFSEFFFHAPIPETADTSIFVLKCKTTYLKFYQEQNEFNETNGGN